MNDVSYISTRGKAKSAAASEAIIKGIAEDGGLFVPNYIPDFNGSLAGMENKSYKEIAGIILKAFFDDFKCGELTRCIEKAYDVKFGTTEIAPVKDAGGNLFLELFHGPTLAFKDMALSILPYLMKISAARQGIQNELVILTATSGDTGKAALEGFNNVEGTRVIVFFPENGVSEIQKRQMITHSGNNTFVIGVRGNFDMAQNGVKDIFTDQGLIDELDGKGYILSSANSINIGRLFPQVVYYFHAYLSLVRSGKISTGEMINVAVPTGNFGNILAAYYSKAMGLPIGKLICASNENRVLYDFFRSGEYNISEREFVSTISPSMDILISSNLERLLYLASAGDSEMTRYLMEQLKTKGRYSIPDFMKDRLDDFYGGSADGETAKRSIREVFISHGYLMDTHTAVAYSVLKKYVEETGDDKKAVIVSTASPFKFPSAVMSAVSPEYIGVSNYELLREMSRLAGTNIPSGLDGIEKRPVVHNRVCESGEMKKAVRDILKL